MRTVNEILREERLRQGLSIVAVEKRTKIKRKFLEAIESGSYKELPSESYAVGFVKNYAKYLELDDYKIGKIFRREYEAESQKVIPSFSDKKNSIFYRLFFTPKFILFLVLLITVIGYLIFQYNAYFFPPNLIVESPQQNQTIQDNIVRIKGKTDPYATLRINGDETYVNLDGSFEKSIYLFSGEREIIIISENRHGKENEKVITVRVP